MIRYYDIKEFPQERETKRLLVELKNSETRFKGIEAINKTYKTIIDTLLHDSLFYQPVLEAINADWNEQTQLVQQTFNIGFPALKHVRKIENEVKHLARISRKEEKERFEVISKNILELKKHPNLVRQAVRRDVS
jgi:hypothetical protein